MTQSLTADHISQHQLPIIDIAGLRSPQLADRVRVGEAINQACTEMGFFYICNHGVSPLLQQQVFDVAKDFFELTLAQKMLIDKSLSLANRGYEPLRGQVLEDNAPADVKEGFYCGVDLSLDDPSVVANKFNHGSNQWPESLPVFKKLLTAYSAQIIELASLLMKGIALSLKLDEDYFAAFCQSPYATLRLLHYPPQPVNAEPNEKGCGAHTDFGGLTLLLQDSNGGLQVLDHKTDRWIHAQPIPNTYVVNLGDLISRWTNDYYRSDVHRVVNTSGNERYSIPFFFGGNPDYLIKCLDNCLATGEQAKYPITTVEAHQALLHKYGY